MSDLIKHYRLLLGLDEAWIVSQVDLAMAEKKVEILLTHRGGRLVCPDCGVAGAQADLAPERQWRHLGTMQFQTIVRARTPRANCPQYGVKTIAVPARGRNTPASAG